MFSFIVTTGTIDMEMFWVLYKEFQKSMDLSQAFETFDRNGDGSIEFKELKSVIMRYKLPEFTEEDLDEMFKVIDLNGDGEIDYQGNDSDSLSVSLLSRLFLAERRIGTTLSSVCLSICVSLRLCLCVR